MRINLYKVMQVKESSGNYAIDNVAITSPDVVDEILRLVLKIDQECVEVFGIITLNTKNKIVGIHLLSKGGINFAMANARDVFMAALLNNASGIILFHNHPSGDPTPSREDVDSTKRLIEAGNIMQIPVLDHIIVGDTFVSLRQVGLI